MLMDNLIGQEAIKSQVRMQAEFCKQYNAVFPHTLLIASAGQGKSTMANAITELIGRPVVQAYCPSIQTPDDLLNLFKKPDGSWRESGFVAFFDEVHSLSLKLAEQLYTMMETFTYAENGVVKRCPKFTLIGATTEPHLMSKPLRDRFINQFVFEPYTNADMRKFIDSLGAAFVLGPAEDRIAQICGHTPRLVKAFMKKLHMYAVTNKIPCFTDKELTEYLVKTGYTPQGLTSLEDKYLKVLVDLKRAALSTIANALGMKQNMVSTIIEPSLIARGYVELGIGGRSLTDKAKEVYGVK